MQRLLLFLCLGLTVQGVLPSESDVSVASTVEAVPLRPALLGDRVASKFSFAKVSGNDKTDYILVLADDENECHLVWPPSRGARITDAGHTVLCEMTIEQRANLIIHGTCFVRVSNKEDSITHVAYSLTDVLAQTSEDESQKFCFERYASHKSDDYTKELVVAETGTLSQLGARFAGSHFPQAAEACAEPGEPNLYAANIISTILTNPTEAALKVLSELKERNTLLTRTRRKSHFCNDLVNILSAFFAYSALVVKKGEWVAHQPEPVFNPYIRFDQARIGRKKETRDQGVTREAEMKRIMDETLARAKKSRYLLAKKRAEDIAKTTRSGLSREQMALLANAHALESSDADTVAVLAGYVAEIHAKGTCPCCASGKAKPSET